MQQREQEWQEERERLLAQISDSQSKWRLAESEKEDLEKALGTTETVINEIAEALNWKR
jgi:chaperonin cofactor prefoldin